MGRCQKVHKIWHSKSIFNCKNKLNLSHFFSLKNRYEFRTTFFVIDIFLKWCLIFDSLPLLQLSIISFDYSWFLDKNLSNFVSLPGKLHNRYCHNRYLILRSDPMCRYQRVTFPETLVSYVVGMYHLVCLVNEWCLFVLFGVWTVPAAYFSPFWVLTPLHQFAWMHNVSKAILKSYLRFWILF